MDGAHGCFAPDRPGRGLFGAELRAGLTSSCSDPQAEGNAGGRAHAARHLMYRPRLQHLELRLVASRGAARGSVVFRQFCGKCRNGLTASTAAQPRPASTAQLRVGLRSGRPYHAAPASKLTVGGPSSFDNKAIPRARTAPVRVRRTSASTA